MLSRTIWIVLLFVMVSMTLVIEHEPIMPRSFWSIVAMMFAFLLGQASMNLF